MIDIVLIIGIMEYHSYINEGDMADVALIRCEDYELSRLKVLFSEGLRDIGFSMEAFRNMKTVLKPNLLSAAAPESAVITHPVFFRAAAELVMDHGGRPVLAESPAVATLDSALKASGYDAVVKDLGIEVADGTRIARIRYEDAQRFRMFDIAETYVDAGIIVNLPKFKTHGLTFITASVKNLFGAIPGLRKSQMHMRVPDPDDFCDAILDLYGAFLHGFNPPKTFIHLMDAVIAMEGDGPGTSGTPRKMNAVIIGQDALAVDWVATQVSGLPTGLSPILSAGFKRDLGISSETEIRILGRTIDEMRLHGFRPSSGPGMTGIMRMPFMKRLAQWLFIGRPVPHADRCTLCRQCEKICPAHAISKAGKGGKVPVFDYGVCIRCLCCMEACTYDAISVNKGLLERFIQNAS